MVKLSATELAKRCALEGMQIMGGYGYATEYPMERYLRAAVVTTIFGGTSEIQKQHHREDARALTRASGALSPVRAASATSASRA